MRIIVLVSMLVFSILSISISANAEWTCTYSCGSKGQEPKYGHGYSKRKACREARSQICTEYEGGYPKYYVGSNYDGGGSYYDEWECVYSCGSKGQERKYGYGYSQYEASRNAQSQICTRYVGGNPQYYQGCRRLDQ